MFPRRRKHWLKPENIELNLSNPIARKFDFYVPNNQGGIAGKDIVGRLNPTVVNTSIVSSEIGKARLFSYPATLDFGDNHDIGTGSFSVGCWFKTTQSASSSLTTKSRAGDETGRWALNIGSGGDLQLFLDGGASNYTAGTPMIWDDNKWHFVVGIIDRDSQVNYLYVDGAEVASVAHTLTTDYQTSNILILGEFGNSTGTAPNDNYQQFIGEKSDNFICHSALSKHEIKSLYDDFYQILQPRTQLLPLTQAAAGGFQAAWATNNNTLIGAL